MKVFRFCIISGMLLMLYSCTKESETPQGNNKIVFGSTSVDLISYYKITVSTQITNFGGNTIHQHGHCWGTVPNPDTNGSHSSLGPLSIPRKVSEQIIGLSPGTKYYIRPYLTYTYGTVYGPQQVDPTTTQVSRPAITTGAISDTTYSSATVSAIISDDGGYEIIRRGFCWNTTGNPTLENCIDSTENVSGTSPFTASIKKLASDVTYYVVAYAINSVGISYGGTKPVPTLSKPDVTVGSITDLRYNSAVVAVTISGDGGISIDRRGICWSKTGIPTLKNCNGYTNYGPGTNPFYSSMTNLTENTHYSIAAYIINAVDTIYSIHPEPVTTPQLLLPEVTTSDVYNITYSFANCGGNVTSDGNGNVTSRGICWNRTGDPTLSHCERSTIDGSGTGIFVSNMTGLESGIDYWVTAYATNEKGTAYGENVKNFPTQSCGSFTKTHTAGDVAPVTKTVTYGAVLSNLTGSYKCWITQNLGASHQATSATDATEASAGWYWQFNRKQGFKHDGTTRIPNTLWINYINQTSDWLSTEDPCTLLLGIDWRIPTNSEWENADSYGGWNNYNDAYDSELKLHNAGGLNVTSGALGNRGSSADYWGNSQISAVDGIVMFFDINLSYTGVVSKANGYSIRCIRDY